MATEADDADTAIPPDDAFGVLGNETRLEILQTLHEADSPLEFSELRDRVGIRDSGQFNYHLSKLNGHFVRKTDQGYRLRKSGRRVVEAILTGAITEDPVLEPTPTEEPCPYCETPVVVAYHQERLQSFCPECPGHYGPAADNEGSIAPSDYGNLGSVPLPPAGLQGRSVPELRQAAHTWGTLQLLAIACWVCPRCAGPLDESQHVCEDHDTASGTCESCGNRHAVQITRRCMNCRYEQAGALVLALMADVDMLAFLSTHGINPISSPEPAHDAVLMDYHEEILSVDPLKARLTFVIDDDVLTLTVDDDLDVVDVTKRPVSGIDY